MSKTEQKRLSGLTANDGHEIAGHEIARHDKYRAMA